MAPKKPANSHEHEVVDYPGKLENGHEKSDDVEHVERLRKALSHEKNLKSRLDDKFLLKFLRARKFDHERALALVKNYYKQRIKYPEFYKNMRSSSLSDAFAIRGLGRLWDKDPEGRTVFFGTMFDEWDPDKVPFLDIIAGSLLALELALEDEEAQENGFAFLFDAGDFGFRHLRAFSPFIIAQVISVTLNSFPAKFKRFHVVNTPKYFQLLFSMMKPFLTKKLKTRFQFHGSDLKDLYKEIPQSILPEEFGGHLGPFDMTEWQARIRANDHVVEGDRTYGYTVH